MGQIVIRKLDDEILEIHRRRAREKKRSLEQEIRELITVSARPSRDDIVKQVQDIAAMTPALPKGKTRPKAEDLIRADRDSR